MDRLQAMLTFVQVVDSGSFSTAARILNIGQPAVSKAVAQLEKGLRVRLLLRTTHGLMPTEAGQRFYERVRVVIREAEEAELAARGAGTGLSGNLRISAAPTFARLYVIPHLPKFMAAHPELKVEIILDDRPVNLVAEGIDVSLRIGKLRDSGAVARKLATSRRSVIATPAYLARCGEPATPAELARRETVIFTRAGNVWRFTRHHSEISVTVQGRVQLSAAEGIRAAVFADMGLTIASDWMFSQELADGRVSRLLGEWSLPDIDLWAVFPSGRLISAKARQFTAFVEGILPPAHSTS